MLDVRFSLKCEHRDRLVAGIDDPVLGNARLGVVGALLHQVPIRVVGADHLGYQVRAQSVAILAAGVRLGGMPVVLQHPADDVLPTRFVPRVAPASKVHSTPL